MRNFVVFFLMKLTISVSGGVLQKYSIQSDTSIASIVSSTLWLIQCYNKSDKTSCLVECNLKTECYSATYNSNESLLDNCALYSKYIATSELVSLKNTNLHAKDCERN